MTPLSSRYGKSLLLLVIASCISCMAYTQAGKNIDSLRLAIAKGKDDTATAKAHYFLAMFYEMGNQDSALYHLSILKKMSERLHYLRGEYLYYERKTVVSYTMSDYTKATEECLKGLSVARQLGDSSYVITMLNNMSIIKGFERDFNTQLHYALMVRDRIVAAKDSAKLSGLYHNLSNVYSNLGQDQKSKESILYSIYLYEKLKLRNDYVNRAYASLAQSYQDNKSSNSDSAIFFYKKAIEKSIAIKDTYAEAAIYSYLANLYAQLGRFKEMLPIAEKSLQLVPTLQNSQSTAMALYNVSEANFYNGNNRQARVYIDSSLAIGKNDSLRSLLQDAFQLLSFIEARDGNFLAAVNAKNQSDSIRAAALTEEIAKNGLELEQKYEAEKKDGQIRAQQADIKQKNILNYLFGGAAVAVLIIGLLGYFNYTNRQKLQQQRIAELETQQQLMATEAVLKGEEQERTRLAKDLHDGLGGMLSGIKFSLSTVKGNLVMTPDNAQAFERSIDMLDSSIKEMRRVAHNMMPEALVKFGLDTALKDFCLHITQTGVLKVNYQSIDVESLHINQTTAITVYRIVQELLNNTIKHATAQTAIVQLSKVENVLNITVEDDGKGFNAVSLQESPGIGWSNIQNRVTFLNGRLDIQSEPGKGTSVFIEVPV